MSGKNRTTISRRKFVKMTAWVALSAGAGPFFLVPGRVQAAQKKLRILRWKHFVGRYDHWFDHVFAKEWGQKHDVKVMVDHVPLEGIRRQAEHEIATRKGHDIVVFGSPPAAYQNEVIDHHETYREVRRHWGEAIELAHKSTFNPRNKKYFAFCDSYIPAPFNWLKNLWTEAGLPLGPIDYETLRSVGRQIREKRGIPCGFGLAEELSSNIALHSVLWSFGGTVQDEQGQVAINSKKTVEALKYIKALYQEAETPKVLRWKPASNEKALLGGRISCTINAISISREAERRNSEGADPIMLSPALRTHSDPLAPPHITQCSAIWSFSENKESAKQFLVDLIGSFLHAFQASESCNFPCFPKTVPDLLSRLYEDPRATPHSKYGILRDTLAWTRNLGYPGYASAAGDEVFHTFVVPRMFARAARGEVSAEESARLAQEELEGISLKWNQR